jgi:hypothetical protein
MAAELDKLRARSDALAGTLDDRRSPREHRAILAIVPGDAVATYRLGAGLMRVGRPA